jgi:hypothetical protein
MDLMIARSGYRHQHAVLRAEWSHSPMTKKQVTLLIGSAVLVAVVAFRLGAQQDTTTCSERYTLVQGEYLFVSSKGANLNERGLFRIDTVTGQTWRFVFLEKETCWDPIAVMQPKLNR